MAFLERMWALFSFTQALTRPFGARLQVLTAFRLDNTHWFIPTRGGNTAK